MTGWGPMGAAALAVVALGCIQTVAVRFDQDATADGANDSPDATCADGPPTYYWNTDFRFTPNGADASCLPRAPQVRECRVRVRFAGTAARDAWCTGRDRTPVANDVDECEVGAAALVGGSPVAGAGGYYYAPGGAGCLTRVMVAGAPPPGEVRVIFQCLAEVPAAAPAAPCTPQPIGAACALAVPDRCEFGDAGCTSDASVVLLTNAPGCASGTCALYRRLGGASTAGNVGVCTCRCGVPFSMVGAGAVPLCACPPGFVCASGDGDFGLGSLRGSYCIRAP